MHKDMIWPPVAGIADGAYRPIALPLTIRRWSTENPCALSSGERLPAKPPLAFGAPVR
jgi:hypothetical protein